MAGWTISHAPAGSPPRGIKAQKFDWAAFTETLFPAASLCRPNERSTSGARHCNSGLTGGSGTDPTPW